MKVSKVNALVKNIQYAQDHIDQEALTPFYKKKILNIFESMLDLIRQLATNSSNSSIAPSQDPNRKKKKKKRNKKNRKPGGQKGHTGNCLKKIENPDQIEEIKIDRKMIPPGNYKSDGFESRQVFDLEIKIHVTEYRAEVLVNEKNERFVAEFPKGVTQPTQYGNQVKATSVYMSQFQLIPLARVHDYLSDQMGLPVAKGSISNWNYAIYKKLEFFEIWAKNKLIHSYLNNVDETGININGKKHWLHCVGNEEVTLFHADTNRGKKGMNRMGVLPYYKGILVHDHWKSYFYYQCKHVLCNAHHLRELESAVELYNQKWAKKMQLLLIKMNVAVDKAGGAVSKKRAKAFQKSYRKIIADGEIECPINEKERAQTKPRNLLTRLRDFELETLRFLGDKSVPFTNNQGENDLRMTKVQQKISGCFRSFFGAKIFARIRSYLLTCMKNGVSPTEALKLVFEDKFPDFMK